jgi:fatty-acyl-CoA synthase
LIVGGVNVFPQDLEDLVSGVAGIRPGRVVAFAVFDPRLQTEKVIILAEPESAPDDAAGLVLRARQRVLGALQIANFEIHLVPAQWLIKSSSGKMSRSANRLRWTASA